MKPISLIVAMMICVCGAWSQEKIESLPKEIPTNVQKPMKVELQEYQPYQQLYVVNDVKKMMTYFVSGQIPTDFPKFDHSKTKKENFNIAIAWVITGNNKNLLTEEAIKKMQDRGDL
ncbi:MAG: hypothetical protein JKY54_00250 [Flavobacteriales bacterium]|nr:hypothetical protein [Flavobacteriales bacterium]